ncbi:MAG: nucleotidyltransferase domain-containing protein [Fibrobacterota bacterium]
MAKKDILEFLKLYFSLNKDKYRMTRLGLFGSAARDQMNDQSDIDLVVELQNPDMFNLIGIKQDVEAALHRHVDIFRFRETMNGFLKKRIAEEAIYV